MFLVLFVGITSISQAQVKVGVRAGISTQKFDPATSILAGENLSLALQDADYGYHAGLFTQFRKGKFFIQPEVVFNTHKINYNIKDADTPNGELVSERYNHLDIPIMMGLKFGFLRLQAGPVGHIYLNNASEIADRVQNYQQTFETMTYGYQAGVGLDFGRVIFDFKWENNFSQFGDHITIAGTQFNSDQNSKRFVASVGFAF